MFRSLRVVVVGTAIVLAAACNDATPPTDEPTAKSSTVAPVPAPPPISTLVWKTDGAVDPQLELGEPHQIDMPAGEVVGGFWTVKYAFGCPATKSPDEAFSISLDLTEGQDETRMATPMSSSASSGRGLIVRNDLGNADRGHVFYVTGRGCTFSLEVLQISGETDGWANMADFGGVTNENLHVMAPGSKWRILWRLSCSTSTASRFSISTAPIANSPAKKWANETGEVGKGQIAGVFDAPSGPDVHQQLQLDVKPLGCTWHLNLTADTNVPA